VALAPERLKLLLKWREVVPELVKIIKELLPEAEVYLVGSVARGDYDAWSDVDLLVVTERELSREERVKLRAGLWEEAERRELPWGFPWQLHFAKKGEEAGYPERRRRLA